MGKRTKEKKRQLTSQQLQFVASYAATGSGTQAAIAAGYAPSNATSAASKLLRNPRVRDAITELGREPSVAEAAVQAIASRGQIADVAEAQAFLTAVMRGDLPDERIGLRDRIRATELLIRTRGGFLDRIDVHGLERIRELSDEELERLAAQLGV